MGDNLCLNLATNFHFSFFPLAFYYLAVELEKIIMKCNGCQTVRTASECNFLNDGINLRAGAVTGKSGGYSNLLLGLKQSLYISAMQLDRRLAQVKCHDCACPGSY